MPTSRPPQTLTTTTTTAEAGTPVTPAALAGCRARPESRRPLAALADGAVQLVRERARVLAASGRYGHDGQAAYRALHELRPDLAASVRGTALDPYYSPARLGGFYRWLADPDSTAPQQA